MRNKKSHSSFLASRISFLRWDVPVGLQLSLIYALLVAATLALLGWALYAQLDSFLVNNTAERMVRLINPSSLRPPPHIPAEEFPAFLAHEFGGSDIAVAVLNAQGKVLSFSASTSKDEPVTIPPLPDGWDEELASAGSLRWIDTQSGSARQLVHISLLNTRIFDGRDQYNGPPLILEQVASLASADTVLNQLRLYIALGILIGTLIGVIAGLALTRATLRPLDRMVRTAEAIAGGDLDRRLRLPSGRNEIARLGSSFDNMVDRLGAALEAQRRFVADASHELRTPLTSLEGMSEMLLMGADRGDASVIQRTVRAMYKELGRMGRLVADLLTLSRLDSTSQMVLKPLDVGKLIAEVAHQMGPIAEAKQVRLIAWSQPQVVVQGEPDRLKRVVLNLVDNAIRYTPPDGEVKLSASLDPTGASALIEVEDTGIGISPEDQARIFDRFYRADLARTRANGNTGLGLAIARAIVVAHNGTIQMQSTPGQGAHFTVVLPSVAATSMPTEQPVV